ncbi:hypothetical protein IGB42_01974 [Andreprevotia sp. IGB-42]|uniref:hypothetical protein n=1 Tax=Andreprevotia sp. IGB-42 TaxID=2497473 RepID=UPI00135930E0|nr:hypothetical protein [Andreprevotia sp. IGB-42]KAF0813623.1 hypothetical protein IGB42_01974 [Andreprevotia sp. IGB-42]
MPPFLNLSATLASAAITLWAARQSRLRHAARFGPAPAAIRKLQWGVFIALFLLPPGLYYLLPAAFLAVVAFGVLALLLFGFRTRSWSTWQALRDGALCAFLATVPCGIVLMISG